MRRFSKLTCLLAGLALAFSAGATSAQAFDPGDLPALEARDYARSQWPDEYSGFWVTYKTPPSAYENLPSDARFHFAFTEGADAKVALLRTMFPPGTFEYVPERHEFSMNELLAVHGQAVADLTAIGKGTLIAPGGPFEYWSVGVVESVNRIKVGVPAVTPELESWALDRWGRAAEVNAELPVFPHPGVPGPGPGVGPAPGKLPDGAGPKTVGPKNADKRRKALVRKCNKAAKSKSAARKRFSKSKKCKRARRGAKVQTPR